MPTLIVTTPCYWLATDNIKVAHFGYADVGTCIATGQPILTTFPTMASLITMLIACNFPIVDGSTHSDREWYIWDNKAKADAALAAINANSAFPVLIPDPATGKHTVTVPCWCHFTQAMIDGSWGFKRIPAQLLDEWKISVESRDAWMDMFKPTIVVDPEQLPPLATN